MNLEKQRFAVGKKQRMRNATPDESTPAKADAVETAVAPPPPAEVETVARRPSAEVAREVYERDEGQCTFVAPDGRRWGAREFVEFDHIDPRAWGGEPTAANLRLRCRPHNQLYARQCYGTTIWRRRSLVHGQKEKPRDQPTSSASSIGISAKR